MNFLVVDDAKGTRRLLTLHLEAQGHRVRAVCSGPEALSYLATDGAIDLVLLDYSMPEMDGMETFAHIHRQWPDLPVVMVTALESISLAVEFMRSGGNMFVVKPFNFELLDLVIKEVTSKAEIKRGYERARRDLEYTLDRMRAIVETSVDGILTIFDDGRIEDFNPAAECIFGYTAAEVRGQNIEILMPERMRGVHTCHSLAGSRCPSSMVIGRGRQLIGRRKDGGEFPLELRVSETIVDGRRLFVGICADITYRKAAESANARLGRIIEGGQFEIYMLAADTLAFQQISRGACRNLGHAPEAMQQMTLVDIQGDLDAEHLDAMLRPLRRGECRDVVFDTHFRRKDGSLYEVEVRIELIDQETPQLLLMFAEDVTDRNAAQRRLEESEARLSAVLNHSPSLIYIRDADGRYRLTNREFDRRNGLRPGEAIGRMPYDFLTRDQADQFIASDRAVLESGKSMVYETEVDYRSIGRATVLVNKFPIPGPDGRPLEVGVVSTDISDRKRAELAWRESEARFRAVVNNAPVAIHLRDREGRMLVVNREWLSHRRPILEPDQVIGRAMPEVYPEGHDVIAEWLAIDRQVIETKTQFQHEVQRRFPDGVEHTLLVTKFPILGDDGAVIAIGGISTDVTEQRRAEIAWRESEARFRALVDNAPVSIHLRDPQGKLLVVNREWLSHRRTILEPDQVIGRAMSEVYPEHHDTIPEWMMVDRQVIESKAPDRRELCRRFADGSEHTFLVTKFPILGDDGTVIAVGGISVETTEQRRAEIAWRESETRFRALVDNAPVSIHLRDREGRFLMANPKWLANQRLRHDQVIGRTLSEIVPDGPQIIREALAADRQVLETKAPIQREMRIRFADGVEHTVIATKFPILDDNGAVVAVGGISTDITELREARQRARLAEIARAAAEQASAAKSTFLANISHELRTPLTAILGFADQAQRQIQRGDVGEVKRHIARIVANSERLAEVITGVLDLSKIESQSEDFVFIHHDFERLVGDAVRDLKAITDRRGLRVAVYSDLAPGREILCDGAFISRVVINLLSNASKFADPGSTIDIRMWEADERAHFVIADTGVPIPGDELQKIFEPFTQSSLTDRGAGGTGLGLALCKRVVEAHGGWIRADADGHRVTFTFSLPINGGRRRVPSRGDTRHEPRILEAAAHSHR